MGAQMSKLDCLAVAASGAAAALLQLKLLDFLGTVDTEAALTAIVLKERKDGSSAIVSSGPSMWLYNATSTATPSSVILEPDDGIGRWFAVSGGAGSLILGIRVASAAALPANTRTANVLLADANAALNDTGIDGITDLAVGQMVLVKDEGTGANNGVYVIDSIGGASAKWQMTRAPGMNASEDIVPSMLFAVSEGTANADTVFVLSTDAVIVLNTTALAFIQIPSLVDLASVAAGEGASLIGVEDSGTLITATEVEGALAEIFTALNTLITDLAAVTAGKGAALIGVEDSGTIITATEAEAAFAEIFTKVNTLITDLAAVTAGKGAALIGIEDSGTIITAVEAEAAFAEIFTKVNTLITDLAAITAGKGASLIGIEDSGTLITATEVEAAFAEIFTALNTLVTDLAAITAGKGASLIGIEDSGTLITATEVEGALAENRAALDATQTSLVTELGTLQPGLPMINRLRMLGAPGAIVEGDTVTIESDVYEFRSSTPPSGGTGGRIWVYQGADSAASRVNLINAMNGVVDAPTITRDGSNVEEILAAAGITTGDVVIQSADAIGGAVIPSAAALACSEGLTTVTDIWDVANTYNGLAQSVKQVIAVSVTVNAAMIAKGDVQVYCDFTPISCIVSNRSRPQDEAYVISGDAVSLTLAGAGSPNNQDGDVVDFVIFG